MKYLKIVIAIVLVIVLTVVIITSNDSSTVPKFNTNTNTNGSSNDNAVKKPDKVPKYKENQDDKDTVVEGNKQIALTLQLLKEEIKYLKDQVSDNTTNFKVNQNTHKPDNTVNSNNPNATYKKVDKKPDNVVDAIKQNVNNAIGIKPFDIGGAGNNVDTESIELQPNYIWIKGLQSTTPSLQSKVEFKDEDIFAEEENTNIPIYTIPTNAILSGVLVTEMLGRIPIDGKVTDHYRFSVRINTKSLFASFKQHNELKGMILSGVTQGDLLLSCATGVLDSATFIFDDGTISQNDISNMAIIIDDYGKPCIKGKLITNAPTYLSISTGLSALSAAAEAVASGEQTTSVDANGNKTESLTGDAVKFAKFNAISGGASNVSQWLDTRAQSTFDVIQVQSGIGVKILTHTNINIDYNPKGRKLTYSNNSSEQSLYDTLD